MPAQLRPALAIIAGAAAFASIAYTIFATLRVRRFARGMKDALPVFTPAITVLKPLCGAEPDLYTKLQTLVAQNYPEFQVIFGAADPGDPALDVARRLQRDYPHVDIAIAAGRAVPARNPKVGNLLGMIPLAKHAIVAVADSDVYAGPEYLRSLGACFSDDGTGAATCLYSGRANENLVSRLGAMHLSEQFAPSALVAAAIGPPAFCFGATMAVRAGVLSQIGGLEALADHLGDDYMLGSLVAKAGHRVALSARPVATSVDERTLGALWSHELRWARTVRAVRPAGFAGSILTQTLALCLAFALISPWPAAGLAALAAGLAARFALHREARKAFDCESRATGWLIPVRDGLSLGVWCATFLGRRVGWRGRVYAVTPDGRMVDRVP